VSTEPTKEWSPVVQPSPFLFGEWPELAMNLLTLTPSQTVIGCLPGYEKAYTFVDSYGSVERTAVFCEGPYIIQITKSSVIPGGSYDIASASFVTPGNIEWSNKVYEIILINEVPYRIQVEGNNYGYFPATFPGRGSTWRSELKCQDVQIGLNLFGWQQFIGCGTTKQSESRISYEFNELSYESSVLNFTPKNIGFPGFGYSTVLVLNEGYRSVLVHPTTRAAETLEILPCKRFHVPGKLWWLPAGALVATEACESKDPVE